MGTSSATDLNSLLVAKPGYRNGWPCLRGTGIPVHSIAAMYVAGLTAVQLCDEYPHVESSLIYAAVAYYLANREIIEQQLEDERIKVENLATQMQKADPEHVSVFRI